MTAKKLIVALGGNALQEAGLPPTAEAQREVVGKTCDILADLVALGYEMAIVHGNGPQVGRIVLASEAARDVTPVMPFDVCGAMSQGYIGYHIQQALGESLRKLGRAMPVVSLVTQVVVDGADPAFNNPTKPIGAFYTEDEAKRIMDETGYVMKEDAGRGWRRVVASPIPREIVELGTVRALWGTTIPVTCGGGGIPVIQGTDGRLEGIAAVIDKDFAAAKLAEDLGADLLMILTEVEKICLNFGKPNQTALGEISVGEAQRYVDEGHFAPGSMLPKVLAAMQFAKSAPGRKAIITSLDKGAEALQGLTGTVISE